MISSENICEWHMAIERELVGPFDCAIRLSRYKWLLPAQSKETIFPSYMILPLLPFAKGHDGSWIGWNNPDELLESEVVLSPRDEEFATVLANRFGDALFFLALDELSDCWIDRSENGKTIWNINEWLQVVDQLLTVGQIAMLRDLSALTPRETPSGVSFISSHEIASLVPGFPFVGQGVARMRQYAPP